MVIILRSLCLAIVCLASTASAQTLYDIRDLGEWWPEALSNNRTVVGTVPDEEGGSHFPGMWQDGRLTLLPLPEWVGDQSDWTNDAGNAVDIDDDGDRIIGDVWAGRAIWPFLTLWEEVSVQALDNVIAVKAVNNLGQIVVSHGGASGRYGYLMGPGRVELEAASEEMYDAVGINNLGQVVGHGPEGNTDFCLWDDKGVIFRIEDLVNDPVPFDRTTGVDINDNTQIIGTYYDDGERGSFLYEAGSILSIGPFNATSINESAQVVGENYLYDYDTGHLLDLNGCIDPGAGWRITYAEDINDESVIIGQGYLKGDEHAFMLIPCDAVTYFHDSDGDGFGDPLETLCACEQPEDYIEAQGIEELITNGGMEGDSNWSDWDSPRVNEQTKTQVFQGNFARHVLADSPNDGIQSESFLLKTGETYRATLWVYGDGSAPLRLRVYRNDRNQFEYMPNGQFPIPPAEWTRYSWTFTPTATIEYALLAGLASEGSAGNFYFDAFSVTRSGTAVSDCDDDRRSIHPGASETCNSRDDDCDGDIDEDAGPIFYRDVDGDGYGDPESTRQACSAPEGYLAVAGDCDDTKSDVHPEAPEICNGLDEDCDGDIDEGVTTTYYRDADGDGFGDAGNTTQACTPPDGYVLDANDCDDTKGDVHPSASETCNGLDDNCNGTIDEGVKTTYYRDADGDDHGDTISTTEACSEPDGYILTAGDCDDNKAHVYPGAVENCNGQDDDCDGNVDEDCIENELPVADAGSDQDVIEGTTITLDGRGSKDPDDAIENWRWVQMSGPTVVLSNEATVRPTFVTPVVPPTGALVSFRLVVIDLKGAKAIDEVQVSIADNGITTFPDGVLTMQTGNQTSIGIKMIEGGDLVAMESVDTTTLSDNGNAPEALLHQSIKLMVRSTNAGENAKLRFYLDEPLAGDYLVFAHTVSKGWFIVNEEAEFNADRTEVVMPLINGSDLDNDGEDNGFIETYLSFGKTPSRKTPESSGSGSGGCFIHSLETGG